MVDDPNWFDEYEDEPKTSCVIYILRYFLLLNWNRNLHVTELEFKALMASVVESLYTDRIKQNKRNKRYRTICIRPTVRCLTLSSWFQVKQNTKFN